MGDLTCLFLTVNKVPIQWAEYQKEILLKAIGDTKVITISKTPLDWGQNLIQDEKPSISNVYRQMLRGAKLADTKYIAIAEDDVLYHKDHFQYRPEDNCFGYNMTRWSLFTWDPVYNLQGRMGNFSLIAPRQLMIDALEERFTKYPDGTPEDFTGELGRYKLERKLGVTPRNTHQFYTTIANVVFHHDYEMDELAITHRKRKGMIRALDIPHWGRSEELVKKFI